MVPAGTSRYHWTTVATEGDFGELLLGTPHSVPHSQIHPGVRVQKP